MIDMIKVRQTSFQVKPFFNAPVTHSNVQKSFSKYKNVKLAINLITIDVEKQVRYLLLYQLKKNTFCASITVYGYLQNDS